MTTFKDAMHYETPDKAHEEKLWFVFLMLGQAKKGPYVIKL